MARLQAELQSAQDQAAASDRNRLLSDRRAKELEGKLEELESQGGKALKAQIKKLESKVRCASNELEDKLTTNNNNNNNNILLTKYIILQFFRASL